MFDSIVGALETAVNAVIDFLLSMVNAIIDFFNAIINDFIDMVLSLPELVWKAFQWFKNETMAVLYNLLKEFVSSMNIPFPSSLQQNIIDAYVMLNIWFPVDAALDIGVILINTWILVLSFKLGIKLKLLIGGLISRPIFK